MIDLYYWPTPNGWKATIALEEMELPYRVVPVNIGRGDQFKEEFLRISPNNRMPAIVDHEPMGGGEPLAMFESGAILLYLAEKSGRFLPQGVRERYDVTQWVMWQMGNLGPMLGQHNHFIRYAPDKLDYAIERYRNEVLRLFAVLNGQLDGREHICGEYSIADMMSWPWVLTYKSQGIDLDQYRHLRRWYDVLKERPALRRGFEVGRDTRGLGSGAGKGPDEEARKHLFGKTSPTGE